MTFLRVRSPRLSLVAPTASSVPQHRCWDLASSMSDSSEHSSASSVVSDAGIMSSPRFKKPGTPRRSLSDRSRPSIKPPALARTLSDRSDKRTGSGSGRDLRPDKLRLARPAGAPGSPSTCTGSPAGRRSLRGSSAVYAASVLLKYGSPVTAPIRTMNELYQHSLSTGPHGQPWTVREGLQYHKKGSSCKEYWDLYDDLPDDLAPGSFVLHYPAHGRAFMSKQMSHCSGPCGTPINEMTGQKEPLPVLLSLVVGSCKTLDDKYIDTGHNWTFDYTEYPLPNIHVFCSIECAAAACERGDTTVDCMTPHPPTWPHSISQEQRQQLGLQAGPSATTGSSHTLSNTGSSPQQQGPKTPERPAAAGSSSAYGSRLAQGQQQQRQEEDTNRTLKAAGLDFLNRPKPIKTSSSPAAKGAPGAAMQSPTGTVQPPQQQREVSFTKEVNRMASMSLEPMSPDRAARVGVPAASQAPAASGAGLAVNPTPLRLTKSTLQRFQVMKAAAAGTMGATWTTALLMPAVTWKETGLLKKFLKQVWAWTKDDGLGCQEGLLLEPEVQEILAELAAKRII